MNRNQIIGTVIGKTLGYSIQGLIVYKIYTVSPQALILAKYSTKYGAKIVKHTCINHLRTDFRSETIFSDAVDASFFAY